MSKLGKAILVTLSLVLLAGCAKKTPAGDAKKDAYANWPDKPIQVIIGASAGGGTDVTGRLTNHTLGKYLNGTLVAVNVAGAGGTIASRQVKDSKPDGFNVHYVNENILAGKISKTVDYSYEAFKVAGITTISTNVCFVSSSKYPTFDALVQAAKANPGKLKYGVEMGTYNPQAAAALMKYLGIKIQIVDTGPLNDSIASLAGGHIDMTAGPVGMFMDYIEKKMFIPHAMLSSQRDPDFPNIPTLFDLKVPFYVPKFFTYLFPKDTPDGIVGKFTAAMEKTVADQEFITAIKAQKFTPHFMNSKDAQQYMEKAYKDMEEFQKILDEYEASVKK